MERRDHHDRSQSHSLYHHDRKRRRHHTRSPDRQEHAPKRTLPFGAREISRHDLDSYRPMFALYLDIQKQLEIDFLDESEVKGRWKSFVGKWNRGELAGGWYDPKTLEKAQNSESNARPVKSPDAQSNNNGDDDDEADYGPSLPTASSSQRPDRYSSSRNHGASIPSIQDIRARDEQVAEDIASARHHNRESLHHERTVARKVQKERLDEILPRAEPGSRERQLEKKREKAESNRSFAASKDASGDAELGDADVMGDEDSLGDVKRMQRENERRKNEREIRKEEVLRARRAEREARVAGMREKEERTMEMLREIARARFGGEQEES